MYNNPAFQLFLMATAEPYNLSWPTGEKEMLLARKTHKKASKAASYFCKLLVLNNLKFTKRTPLR
jgi:hypothetical protein